MFPLHAPIGWGLNPTLWGHAGLGATGKIETPIWLIIKYEIRQLNSSKKVFNIVFCNVYSIIVNNTPPPHSHSAGFKPRAMGVGQGHHLINNHSHHV